MKLRLLYIYGKYYKAVQKVWGTQEVKITPSSTESIISSDFHDCRGKHYIFSGTVNTLIFSSLGQHKIEVIEYVERYLG